MSPISRKLFLLTAVTIILDAVFLSHTTALQVPDRTENNTVSKVYWKIYCGVNRRLNDDPIIFPRQPGRSHSHDFFGATNIDAYTSSTKQLLKGGSSCIPPGAKSGYWIPTLYRYNKASKKYVPEKPRVITVYYFNKYHGDLVKTTRALPNGLRMICGNATAKSAAEVPLYVAEWFCSEEATFRNRTRYSNFPKKCSGLIMARVYCPSCWDGKNLDSTNHKSHIAYVNGTTTECPASHPVRLPEVHVTLTYNFSEAGPWPSQGLNDKKDKPAVKLSTIDGAGWQLHLDVWEAWEAKTLKTFVNNCWNAGITCGPDAKSDIRLPE